MFSEVVTKLSNMLQRMEEFVLSSAILIIAGLTIANVFCRSLLGFSLTFAEEVSQFCIIVVCFVGLSYAASKGRHIRMTAIYDQMPARVRKAMMVVITTLTSAIMFFLAWYAGVYVATVHDLGGVYPALGVPFYMVYAVAPAGFTLAGVHYGLAALKNLSSEDVYVSFEKKDEYLTPEI